jgi:hypothetical protein
MSVYLSERAMLVSLNISQWSARKYDRKVSDKIAVEFHTKGDSGRYNKILIAQEAIKKIQTIVGVARNFHYENTLPWRDDGARILPSDNYFTYTQRMREYRGQFESSVNDFINNYDSYVDEARDRLNGMFKAEDYPLKEDLPKKWGFEVTINPIPNAADFRVALQEEDILAIKEDIERRLQEAQKRAMDDLWRRLYEVVKHMANKLSDKDGKFKDSLVGNVVDLCSLLPSLNFGKDSKLEELRWEVESRLCGYNPDELRNNKNIRSEIAKNAQDILNTMNGYLGVKQ